jgi:guanylate kinase
MATKPQLVLLSGPSGAGKTVILQALLKRDAKKHIFAPPRSVTSRPREHRKGGDTGFWFVSEKKFLALRRAGRFIETAQVHGQWYGTLHSDVDQITKRGRIPIKVMDVQGFRKVKRSGRYQVCAVFITAESISTLKKRIIARDPSMAPEKLEKRLVTARKELGAKKAYDAVVINKQGKLQTAVKRVAAAIDKCLAAG